jgi:hypothetical protein
LVVRVDTLEQQVQRALQQYHDRETDIREFVPAEHEMWAIPLAASYCSELVDSYPPYLAASLD